MKAPQVSILMPMRNAAQWIDECIESIQQQSFTAWELVVIDDHSTDTSYQQVTAKQKHDSRIKLIRNPGIGIIPALQCAFGHARGTYITRMDADDLMPKDKLEAFYHAVVDHPDHIVTGKVEYFGDDGSRVSAGYRAYEAWLNERVLKNDHWEWIYRECVIASANWMAHRSSVDLATVVYPEDYDLVFKWYERELPVLGIDQVTHLWREHPTRTSRTSEHYQQERFFAMKMERFLALDYDPQKELRILGKNIKSKLVTQALEHSGVPYQLVEKEDIHELQWNTTQQCLIAVYPEEDQRRALQSFFLSKGLLHGKNYWWV